MGGILRHSKLVTMEKADMKVAKNLGAFGYLYSVCNLWYLCGQ